MLEFLFVVGFFVMLMVTGISLIGVLGAYREVIYLILVGISGNWRELMGFLEVRSDFLI